jgi:penicillin-binding protein 1A
MSGALTKSVNVVAAQLIEKVGIQKTIDLAEKMGITSRLPREYGISLGAADITLYDMIKVYGTMANAGMRPEPVTVLKVEDRNGNVLYDYKKELALHPELGPHVQALTEDQASIMTEMLQNVINYGTGSRLRRGFGITGDFAGKTGTTQNQSDGWFICYNPQLVTGAWVGAPSPAVRFRSMVLGQGSAMALPIVAWFWHKIANDRKLGKLITEKFPDPKPEVSSQLGCYPWIGINPDSFHTLMQQDSSFRDSIILIYTKKPDKTTENEPSEAPVDPASKKEEEPVDGKKQGLFKKIFGHRREEEKEKDKKGI